MYRVLFVLCSLLLTSCNYFESKKVSKDSIVEQELKTFTWNEVDTYPSFKICDSFETEALKKTCFETEITNQIFEALNKTNVEVYDAFSETIELQLIISEEGVFSISSLKTSDSLKTLIPEINKVLSNSITNLPKVYPAIKRGQYVKTQFVLPILIEIN
jgi:flagellar motor protein MotB